MKHRSLSIVATCLLLILNTLCIFSQTEDDSVKSVRTDSIGNMSYEEYLAYTDSIFRSTYPDLVKLHADPKKLPVEEPEPVRSGYDQSYAQIDITKAVGEIPFESGITPTGARTYTVPINIYQPDGVFAPELSLVYNSQQGNGTLGVGWSIGGLQAITRGNKSIYYDDATSGIKMDENDAFYLSGTRLIFISSGSTEKQYESETGHIKVTGYYTDHILKYFKVFYPNGYQGTFGYTYNTYNQLTYPLTELTDDKGNNISYNYSFLYNTYNINSISYSPSCYISFEYTSSRPDTIISYRSGMDLTEYHRLQNIKCYFNNTLQNEYTLTYTNQDNFSVLTQIGYSANGSSLNPLRFFYGTNALNEFKVSYGQFSDGYGFTDSDDVIAIRGRFDYSSSDDGIICYPNYNPYKFFPYPFQYGSLRNDYDNHNAGTNIYLYTKLDNTYVNPLPNVTTGTGFIRMLCADLEGTQEECPIKVNNVVDGSNDKIIFSVYKKDANGNLGLSYTRYFSFPTVLNSCVQPKDYYVGDFNGDGKAEIMAISAHNPLGETNRPSKCYIFDLENNQLLMNTHILNYTKDYITGTIPPDIVEVFDYDGDGKTDLCYIGDNDVKFYSFENCASGITTVSTPTSYGGVNKGVFSQRRCLFGDLNGDGLVDIIETPWISTGSNSWNQWIVLYNKGDGNFSFSTFYGPTCTQDKKFIIQDIDNDGTSDIVCQEGDTLRYYRMRNGHIISTENESLQYDNSCVVPIRLNSSTTSNILVSFKGTNFKKFSYKRNARNELLATGMSNSLGIIQNNIYHVITQDNPSAGVYTRSGGGTTTFPYIKLMEPIAVLSGCYTFMNSTVIDANHYYYTDAVFHRHGLGFCGFTEIEAVNAKGQHTTMTYDPYHFGNLIGTDSPTKSADYTYTTNVLYNKLRRNNVLTAVETDKLKNVTWTTTFSYNSYDYPTTVTRTSAGYTITQQYGYNPLTNISERYQLDLLDSQSETIVKGSTTCTTSTAVTSRNTAYLPTTIIKSINGLTAEQITRTYNTIGQLLSQGSRKFSSNNELTITNTYNTYKQLSSTTDAMGNTISYTYDSYGNPVTKTDNSGTTEYSYDAFRRVVSEELPTGTINTTVYEWYGQPTTVQYSITKSSNASPATITIYDGLNREIRTSQQLFNNTYVHRDKQYDTYGRLSMESQPFTSNTASTWNTYSYDSYDRILQFAQVLDKTITYSYSGNTVTESNGQNTSVKTFDAMGRLTQVTDNSGTTTYSLHANGSPLSINVLGNDVTFTYDSYGRRTSMSDPSHGTTSYAYDADGNSSEITDANGNTTQMTYDQYGRMTAKEHDEFTTTYTYNNTFNKLASVTSTNGTSTTITYDTYGRVSVSRENATSNVWFQQTHTYDSSGKLASTAYESNNGVLGTENYTYTSQTLSQVKWGTNSIFKLSSLSSQGQPALVESGSVNRIYAYLSNGLPAARLLMKEGHTLKNQVLLHDSSSNNITGRRDFLTNITEYFSYDALDRLTSYGGVSVSYDNYGNITSKGDVGTYNYNNSDKPFAVTDVTLNGTTLLGSQSIAYTSFNRPESISENGYTATFTYNANDDRVRMVMQHNNVDSLTRYYLGGRYEADVVNGSTTERLYLGGSYYDGFAVLIKQGNTSSVYHISRDHLGSITHIFNSNGTIVQELSYDAWGRLRNPQNQVVYAPGSEPVLLLGRGYCGHEHLREFGLINMNARLYDPMLGRFLSPDPYVQMPDFAQNYNRYGYCMNSPLMYVDKDGKFWWFIAAAVIGGIINTAVNWGDIDNFADGLCYFGVGALAGVVGAYTGGLSYGIGGAAGGLIAGGVSGATSGAIIGGGNTLIQGGSFSDVFNAAWQGAFVGAVTGAVIGGVAGGIQAHLEGNNWWNGNSLDAPQWYIESNPEGPQSITGFNNDENGVLNKFSPYEKGEQGVQRAMEEFKEQGGKVLGREVTIEADGTRVRIDFIGEKDGMVHLFEVKNGQYARFTHNQSIVYPKLERAHMRFIPIGKNALGIKPFRINTIQHTPFSQPYQFNYIHYY